MSENDPSYFEALEAKKQFLEEQYQKAIEDIREQQRIIDFAKQQMRLTLRNIFQLMLGLSKFYRRDISIIDREFTSNGWEKISAKKDTTQIYVWKHPEDATQKELEDQHQLAKDLHSYAIASKIPDGPFVAEEDYPHAPLDENETYILLRPKGYTGEKANPAIGLVLRDFGTEEGVATQFELIPPTAPVNQLRRVQSLTSKIFSLAKEKFGKHSE